MASDHEKESAHETGVESANAHEAEVVARRRLSLRRVNIPKSDVGVEQTESVGGERLIRGRSRPAGVERRVRLAVSARP